MIVLQPREYRRVINRFIESGDLHFLVGGGVRIHFQGCTFTVTDHATWHKRRYITDYIIKGQGWMINLLDTSNGAGGRMLTQVRVTGDGQKARREMLQFLREIY